ncbi:hypothetical protein SCOCK_210139 [Actinacidiphila cocklensis]|uniref:Uncharacterized protein n=1 Tax=Actinacidiphila cocklensis TaxID=887465 RepID=A0A9W4E5K1_9ACTN|nr:hypothetical protein SCOCK_210139 [Actinacidiphila cocklensis]
MIIPASRLMPWYFPGAHHFLAELLCLEQPNKPVAPADGGAAGKSGCSAAEAAGGVLAVGVQRAGPDGSGPAAAWSGQCVRTRCRRHR